MATKRINTSKMLTNDGYYNGGIDVETINTTNISISPYVSEQYDFSVTDDPELMLERNDTAEKLYQIYIKAPFAKDYVKEDSFEIKVPKEDIKPVFWYMKEKLSKVKKLSAFETVIAINEFFEFNYEYVIKRVVSPKMLAEIYEDYYNNMGMKNRIDEVAAEPLF